MASVRKRTWSTATGEVKTAWQVDFIDGKGDRQRRHFHLKKQADAFRIDVQAQVRGGTHRPDAERLTIKGVCANFLEHCEGRHRRDERMSRKMLAVYRGQAVEHGRLEDVAADVREVRAGAAVARSGSRRDAC